MDRDSSSSDDNDSRFHDLLVCLFFDLFRYVYRQFQVTPEYSKQFRGYSKQYISQYYIVRYKDDSIITPLSEVVS